MQTNCYCSLAEAEFAFFPLKKRGFFWKIICKMLSRMTLVFGYARLPSYVAKTLRRFRDNEGKAEFCGTRLALIIFQFDLDAVPLEDREDYITECHERIMWRVFRDSHTYIPIVWIFGPTELIQTLSGVFLKGGAPVYYHSKEHERGDIHALIVDDVDEPFYFPKPLFVHEKNIFHGFVPN